MSLNEAQLHNLHQLKRKEGAHVRAIVIGESNGRSRVVIDGIESILPQKVVPGKDRLIDVKVERVDLETGAVQLALLK